MSTDAYKIFSDSKVQVCPNFLLLHAFLLRVKRTKSYRHACAVSVFGASTDRVFKRGTAVQI